jgi:hypothetical protein
LKPASPITSLRGHIEKAEGCDMALRRYRGRRGRRRAWISAYREDVCAVAGAEECDMALADTEDVADDGEHGYRRAERTYAPWQARRDAIWL